MVEGGGIAATILLLARQPGGGDEFLLRASQRQHPLALSLFRPHSAERTDSAIPAAGESCRLLQYVSRAIPGDTIHPARHRRPISALGEGTGREATSRSWRRRRAVVTTSSTRISNEPSRTQSWSSSKRASPRAS